MSFLALSLLLMVCVPGVCHRTEYYGALLHVVEQLSLTAAQHLLQPLPLPEGGERCGLALLIRLLASTQACSLGNISVKQAWLVQLAPGPVSAGHVTA